MEFHPKLAQALRSRNIYRFTDVQRRAIPVILAGKNVLVVSPTGTGKTEAAMIPVFQRLLENPGDGIRCVYITPLRALNRDMLLRLEDFGRSVGLRVAVRHGDTSQSERRKLSRDPPDVLITTPETFQIMFLGKRLRESLRNIRYVVVDEVHELAGDERGSQLSVALERLRNMTHFQIIGLSATVGNTEEIARFLSPEEEVVILNLGKKRNMKLHIETPSAPEPKLGEIMGCEPMYAATLKSMWDMASTRKATLVFVNTRCTAEDIGMRYNLWLDSPPIAVHHGSLSKEHRVEVEERFKSGEIKMLICTSSLELGIDVGIVDLVMQYNSPRQVSKLIQRVGRSGHSIRGVPEGIIYADNPVEIWESGAIASLVKRGWIENVKIRKKPLIVLFNQIVAMAMAEGRVNARDAYNTVSRAYVFQDLTWDEFEEVLKFASEVRKIWYDGSEFGKSRSGMMYFYSNISMIPDEKSYRVVDTRNRFIGMLDERFVSTLNLGDSFVMTGRTWRVISIGDDRVMVEYINDISMPPSWIGEEIPVPYRIAREEPDREVMSPAARKMISDFRIWNTHEITIERGPEYVFLGLRGGTKVNYTVGLIISSILSQKIGESVDFSETPYGVAFFNIHISVEDVEKILRNLRNVEKLVRIVARNSRIFRYTFVHVAKKMGVIRKDATLTSARVEKIMDMYRDSVLYREVVDKLMHDYMDIEHTVEIMKKIRAGELKIIHRALSKEARLLVQSKGDTASPIVATRPVLEAVRRRLLNEELVFLCLSCRRSVHIHVKDFDKAVCPFCGSVRVVLLKPYEEELVDKIRRGRDEELRKDEMERLMGISHLLRRHRKVGAMALAARGVGLKTAARILSYPYEDDIEVVRRILKEELKYAKNRQFWD